jgi:hypothetical protein
VRARFFSGISWQDETMLSARLTLFEVTRSRLVHLANVCGMDQVRTPTWSI